MSKPRCLLVDDEVDVLDLLKDVVEKSGFYCYTATNLDDAYRSLAIYELHFCITDMKLDDEDGMDLISHIQQRYPIMPVAMISGYGSIEKAVTAIQKGAIDFIEKPIDNRKITKVAKKAYKLWEKRSGRMQQLIGQSKAMKKLRNQIVDYAKDDKHSVHIYGETGTGKDVVAKMIHSESSRANQPFIAINCGAITENLVESILFGHVKGSFTGAITDNQGLFLAADQGTLFLDEIADLPPAIQVKLLQVLQDHHILPVGSSEKIPVNVRVLSATHGNLKQLCEQEKFRLDLYYRITSGYELSILPLRERLEDIKLLAEHILKLDAPDRDIKISGEAIDMLCRYDFPGNVRELQTIIIRAGRSCEKNNRDTIQIKDLQSILPTNTTTLPNDFEIQALEEVEQHALLQPEGIVLQKILQQIEQRAYMQPHDNPLDSVMERIEKQVIISFLEKANGNKTKAAKMLGLSFGSFRSRVDKYHIKPNDS